MSLSLCSSVLELSPWVQWGGEKLSLWKGRAISLYQAPWKPENWERGDAFLNQLSDSLAMGSLIPTIQAAYKGLGEGIAYCAGSSGDFVRRAWRAPLNSQSILRVTEKVENWALHLGKRKPTSRYGLQFLDTCLISSAQQLYPYVKEVNYILKLPERIRNFVEFFEFEHFFMGLSKLFGRAWKVVSLALIGVKNALLFLANGLINALDFLIQLFTQSQLQFFGYMRTLVAAARKNVHGKFTQVAHNAIDRRENKQLEEVTTRIADTVVTEVTKRALRGAFKGLITYAAYAAVTGVATAFDPDAYLGVHALALATLAGAYWTYSIKPMLEPLYETHQSHFNPNRGYLREFCQNVSGMSRSYVPLKISKWFFGEAGVCPG